MVFAPSFTNFAPLTICQSSGGACLMWLFISFSLYDRCFRVPGYLLPLLLMMLISFLTLAFYMRWSLATFLGVQALWLT